MPISLVSPDPATAFQGQGTEQLVEGLDWEPQLAMQTVKRSTTPLESLRQNKRPSKELSRSTLACQIACACLQT